MRASPQTAARKRARVLLTLAAIGCLLLLALGFLGPYARPLDSFSHFRAHVAALAALLGVLALPLRQYALAAALLAGAGAAAATTLVHPSAPVIANEGGAVYALLQMNLRWDAADRTEAVRRIAEADADIVTLQEMTPDWRLTLAPLEARYPFQVHCPGADGFLGDSALLSRRPFVRGAEPVCDERNSFAEARIDFNGTGVSVASHHQLWPWPAGQWRRFERLRPTLEALPAPVILAGDFNAVPWSAFLAAYGEALGARVVRGIGPVWAPSVVPDALRRTLGLPLGNILASPEIAVLAVERMNSTTSDHLPVLVRFTVSRPRSEGPEISVAGPVADPERHLAAAAVH